MVEFAEQAKEAIEGAPLDTDEEKKKKKKPFKPMMFLGDDSFNSAVKKKGFITEDV